MINNNTYYCYSSGCLGYILAAASVHVDAVLIAAERVQKQWLEGQVHRYDVVPSFLNEVLPPFEAITLPNNIESGKNGTTISTTSSGSSWDTILSQLRILVTVMESGSLFSNPLMRHRVHTPTCYTSLVQYLQQTTHIPLLTGPITQGDIEEVVVDGGFSRTTHPSCDRRISVPVTWSTMIHSLNPGLDSKSAKQLFHHGMADAANHHSPTSQLRQQ
jgi:hypothetical protein